MITAIELTKSLPSFLLVNESKESIGEACKTEIDELKSEGILYIYRFGIYSSTSYHITNFHLKKKETLIILNKNFNDSTIIIISKYFL